MWIYTSWLYIFCCWSYISEPLFLFSSSIFSEGVILYQRSNQQRYLCRNNTYSYTQVLCKCRCSNWKSTSLFFSWLNCWISNQNTNPIRLIGMDPSTSTSPPDQDVWDVYIDHLLSRQNPHFYREVLLYSKRTKYF